MFSVQPFSCTYTSTKSLCDFVRVAPVSVAVNCLLRAALFKCNSYIGMRVNYNPLGIPMNHTCFMYENCTRRWFFECRFFFLLTSSWILVHTVLWFQFGARLRRRRSMTNIGQLKWKIHRMNNWNGRDSGTESLHQSCRVRTILHVFVVVLFLI